MWVHGQKQWVLTVKPSAFPVLAGRVYTLLHATLKNARTTRLRPPLQTLGAFYFLTRFGKASTTRSYRKARTCVIRSGRRHLTTSSFRNGRLSSSRQSSGNFSTSGVTASNHSLNRGADSATSLPSLAKLNPMQIDGRATSTAISTGDVRRIRGGCTS